MPAYSGLKDCYKKYTHDQDKAFAPEETTARVRRKLAEAGLDILGETERIDAGRLDIPVYISRCGADAQGIMPTRKQMGKGATPAQAEASAVMELVERFSFFHFARNNEFIQGTYDQVRDRAMPFEQIAEAVHHDPSDLDRAERAFRQVPLTWAPAYNLTRGREALVPFNWFFRINEFNGPAAGATLEEALIQGLSEVVERHVSALVCRGRLSLPSIDPESLRSPAARELTDKFRKNGINLFVKDFTLGLAPPTVGALAWDPSTFPRLSEIVFTAGTAPDPEKAYIRALTEVAQLAGDFNTRANFVASGLPKYTDLKQADYITREAALVPISSLPNLSHDNIRVEIESAVQALAEQGFEVWFLDVTHPLLGVPAVYVVIPGAHFRERAPASSVPYFAAGLLSEITDGQTALNALDELGRQYPDEYYLDFHRGLVLQREDRPDLAARAFFAALKKNPPEEDLTGTMTYLGLALKDMGQYARAVDVLERSAALDQDRRDTFNLLGFCYFKTGDHEKAVAAFERVLQLDPGSGIDYANLAVNLDRLGRREEAVGRLKTALKLDPSLDWAREKLAEIKG